MALASNRWVRILGTCFLMYTVSFMDRTNIAMGIPLMRRDLGFSAAAIGFATGIFFFGYLVLQIPAGRLATTWSVRKLIFVLLIAWGLISMSTALVDSQVMLALNRLLLGIAEGGVLTATIVLIRRWFPRAERARANMVFLASIPFAGFVSNPISGWLLHAYGWRAMFIIEAIPAFVWAGVWYWAIADRPEEAAWLDPGQRQALASLMAREAAEEKARFVAQGHWTRAILYPPVLWFVGYSFFSLLGSWGLSTWMPSLFKSYHISIEAVGLLAALPYFVGIVSMVFFAFTSDRLQDRKWHMVALTGLTGVFLLIAVFLQAHGALSLVLAVLLFSLAHGVFYGRSAPFWTLPSDFLPAELLGVGVALANGIGNLGGFFGPFIVGLVRTETGSFTAGIAVLGISLIGSVFCLLPIRTWTDRSAMPADTLVPTAPAERG